MKTPLRAVQTFLLPVTTDPGGGGVLPYVGYIGMCRCEGYGFQAVCSRIGSRKGYYFSGN